MNAKEIAEKYAGRIVKCKVSNGTANNPVLDPTGHKVMEFEARILGWKKAQSSYYTISTLNPEYVCVEVLPPHTTETRLAKFNQGYTYTHDKNPDGYGRRVLPSEITLPADPGTLYVPRKTRDIPEWPHKCRDCGSPAQILGFNIDCSNTSCKNKYKTHSGLDLFLPKDLRERLAQPKPIVAVKSKQIKKA